MKNRFTTICRCLVLLVPPFYANTAQAQVINLLAGIPGEPGFVDNVLANEAQFNYPQDTARCNAGILISDFLNNRIRLLTFSDSGRTITTLVGNGTPDYAGDNGPPSDAALYDPTGLAVEPSGNIFYIADAANNVVRRVSLTTNVITTVAGNGTFGYSGDNGPATSAQLASPHGVALDSGGNLLIADTSNHAIRRVTPGGTITTVAGGNGFLGDLGDGGPAELAVLWTPSDVDVDSNNNLYIAQRNLHVIRVVDNLTGNIDTIAGSPFQAGYAGMKLTPRWRYSTGRRTSTYTKVRMAPRIC